MGKELLNFKGVPQYLCVGVFVVGGKACSFYGCIADKPKNSLNAQDIPVLIQGDEDE